MDVIGIIAEYNPFHNGHIYHIEKIKEKYPDSILILVLNGYFLERGEISILTKEEKTKIALDYGVNIVLELPFIYGTQSADVLKLYLDEGYNYPSALAKACNVDFDFNPNDLLGISYIKSIIKNNFDITPECILRTNSYHDTKSNENIVSASNIRSKMKVNEDISKYLPNDVIDNLIRIDYSLFFKLLKAKIMTDDNLQNYVDVDEGIEYRLKKYVIKANNLDEFIKLIKTKRYTYNKINRMFIHILVGLKKSDNLKVIDYTKILGFDKKGLNYLNKIKNNVVISNGVNTKSNTFKYELQASLIYDLINSTNTFLFELKSKPVIKN